MKAGWERSNEYIMPDMYTIQNMLNPFLKGKRIDQVQRLSGGLNNSNIKIITNTNEIFVLRIYPKENKSMKIESEIAKLLEGRVPVPKVLYSDSSCSVFNYPFLLMNWVRGEQLSEMMDRKNEKIIWRAATAAGAALAEVHKMKFHDSGFFDGQLNIKEHVKINANTFIAFIEEILKKGYVIKHIGGKLCSSVLNFSKEHAFLLDDPGEQNSLVHSDFNPLNILVEEEDSSIRISAILDWEYAFSGSPLIDIGNMLRYEGVTSIGMLKPFILSYRENGGVLLHEWLQRAKLLDLIALLDLLNKEECGEVRVKDITRLISHTMDEWERYAAVQMALN
ncbi:aminoglycoside phosphotransferase family protein [Rossellomorea oryzaecorticis]